jgi:Zn-dependent peptidase ImmA (M78 family)
VVRRRWSPWKALRESEELEFERVPMPRSIEALYAHGDGRPVILVNNCLGRRMREAALAHELIHHERGGTCSGNPLNPPGWRAVELREEREVDRIVAERMLDAGEVLAFCSMRDEMGEHTTPADVAEAFDVAEWVAERRLEGLTANG